MSAARARRYLMRWARYDKRCTAVTGRRRAIAYTGHALAYSRVAYTGRYYGRHGVIGIRRVWML